MKRTWEEYALIAVLAAQLALVCLGVASRYALSWQVSFTEEITRYLLVWLACLGTPACLARGEMIHFQWTGRMAEKWPRLRKRAVWLVSAAFFLVAGWASLQMTAMQWRYGQTTSVMGWPIVWAGAALPAVCGLYLFRLWQQWRRDRA